MKKDVIVCIGTVGRPTFEKCYRSVQRLKKVDPRVKKIVVIENQPSQAAWLNEMLKQSQGYTWCLQVDEDMYLKRECITELIKLAVDHESRGVKILNASGMLRDLFLNKNIGSLKLWRITHMSGLRFNDVLGSDRDIAEQARKLGLRNVSTTKVLGEHDSAPNKEIAESKYYTYAKKLHKFGDIKDVYVLKKEIQSLDAREDVKHFAIKGVDRFIREIDHKCTVSKTFHKNKKLSAMKDFCIKYLFDNAYILNLKRRPEKATNAILRCEKVGINPQIVYGVDGSDFKIKEMYEKVTSKPSALDKKIGRKALQSSGALGCLISHINIIEDAKKNKYEKILVLEDDVVFSNDFLENASKVCTLEDNWDIIYFGASQHNWKVVKDFSDDFYIAKETSGTFAFIVKESAYDEILECAKNMNMPIDTCIINSSQKNPERNCLVFKNNIAIADISTSDIREARGSDFATKKMKWNLENFNFNVKKQRLFVGVKSFNRLDYIKNFIESFSKTKSDYFDWTLMICDDGSDEKTRKYIDSISIKDVNVIKVFNQRIGVHRQTNQILKEFGKSESDLCFVCDDDIFFKSSGWDHRYFQVIKTSGFDHLCYYNESWKRKSKDVPLARKNLLSKTDVLGALGCFWTVTKRVLQEVGLFDVDNFGFRGMGHLDYSYRCCNAGFNEKDSFFDMENSNDYIDMQKRSTYVDTYNSNFYPDRLSRSKSEIDRKMSIIKNSKRRFIWS